MQIFHRISISATPEIQAELAAIGIVVGSGFVNFDVKESDGRWPNVQRWIVTRGALDFVSTRFSQQEIALARWLELMPDWHHGYPQPKEDIFGYRQATYDLSSFCEECGTGARQKAAFQMKGEPRWGGNSILQLNWIFDEFFVKPEVWTKVFEPYGIAKRQVINTAGAELKTVVQLIVEDEVDIEIEGLQVQTCGNCGRNKYAPVMRGPFPKLATEPAGHMVQTRQYFGSGASAGKRVLISRNLAQALDVEDIRGASVRPVAGAKMGRRSDSCENLPQGGRTSLR